MDASGARVARTRARVATSARAGVARGRAGRGDVARRVTMPGRARGMVVSVPLVILCASVARADARGWGGGAVGLDGVVSFRGALEIAIDGTARGGGGGGWRTRAARRARRRGGTDARIRS